MKSIVKPFSLVIITFSVSIFLQVHAEENPVETVVIIGDQDSIEYTDLVGSVDIITKEELAYEHVNDTLELFNKAPGVYLSRYNQGVINTDVAIRGFAGDGVTPHAKLLVDGIPSNYHNGYNELDQLFPLSIDSISLFKGTSDPRYGLFNIAGNYNVYTRQDEAKEIEVNYGSFNTLEAQGYAGFSTGNLTHSYTAGYRTGEGYRDHTDLDKYALAGTWELAFDGSKTIKLIARHANYEGDSPGYLTKDEARRDPEQSASFANQDGGDKTTNHLSVHWDQAIYKNLDWSVKSYVQNFERQRWVRFSQVGSLRDRFDDQTMWGFISTLDWAFTHDFYLQWGIDYESQDILEQRFNTIGQARVRDTASPRRNLEYDFNHYGTYFMLGYEPNDQLKTNVSVRADRLEGDLFNHITNQEQSMFDFDTILQPKFNIVYAPFDTVNLFFNIGRSFQHPVSSAAYGTIDVSINDGWEIGTQWSPSEKLSLRFSYWEQEASDEFIIDPNSGASQNVGETERRGIDLALNGTITSALSYWSNISFIDSEIINTSAANVANTGNELRSIPEFTASLGVNYQVTPKFVTRLHLDAQGDYYVNETNLGGQFGDYTILSASADYDLNWAVVKFQLNNITDEFYEYVFDFGNAGTATIHSPGDGINGSVSLNLEF